MTIPAHGTERRARAKCPCELCEARRVRDRKLTRARKESYGGKCLDCGAPTSGSNGRAKAPLYCSFCWHRNQDWESMHGSGPRQQKLIGYLTTGEHTFTEIREYMGARYVGDVSVLLDRLLRYGLIKRVRRGVYRLSDQWYVSP